MYICNCNINCCLVITNNVTTYYKEVGGSTPPRYTCLPPAHMSRGDDAVSAVALSSLPSSSSAQVTPYAAAARGPFSSPSILFDSLSHPEAASKTTASDKKINADPHKQKF